MNDGTIDAHFYYCSPLVKELPYICGLVKNNGRQTWNFLKKNVYSKVDKKDILQLVEKFSKASVLHCGAIKESTTIENELYWVNEFIQFGIRTIPASYLPIEKYAVKSCQTLDLLFQSNNFLVVNISRYSKKILQESRH